MLVAEYASFSHQARTLKTDLLQFNINFFSKYCSKAGSLCLLFLSSHMFTALETYSNYFGYPSLKKSHVSIVKLNHQSEKYSENINQSDIIF